MADRPDVLTARNIIRAQLAAAFPGNTRLQRAFETLMVDVSNTLPDAIATTASDAADAATLAQAAGATALALAAQALARDDAPPMLYDLHARLAKLERDVANLKEGPIP